jgi:hypothetical protein
LLHTLPVGERLDVVLAVWRVGSKPVTPANTKNAKQSLEFFLVVAKDGPQGLLKFAMLTHNDYGDNPGVGPAAALRMFATSNLLSLADRVVEVDLKLATTSVRVAEILDRSRTCFEHGIVTVFEQEQFLHVPLSRTILTHANKACLGALGTDADAITRHTTDGSGTEYYRYPSALFLHPNVWIGPDFNLERLALQTIPINECRFIIASRGCHVPKKDALGTS